MTSAFYEAGPLRRIATNLFYGWGYNFYRRENQLRADDLLVRAQVGALLLRAQASVTAAEAAYRREHMPPPSREKPRPDGAAMAAAQTLERLAREIGALEAQIRAQPAPANDRMTQRYRQEAATLARLVEIDERLVGQAETLRALLAERVGGWLAEHIPAAEDGLRALRETLSERQALLLS